MVCDDCKSLRSEIAELKAASKMNELRIEALLELLAKEGVISRDDFDDVFSSLCAGDGA